jgi:hypothetical protein
VRRGDGQQTKIRQKIFIEQAGQNRGQNTRQPRMSARARFVLVVSGLKPDRERGTWRGLVANSTPPVLHGVSVLLVGNRLGLQISKPDDKQVNANGEKFRVFAKRNQASSTQKSDTAI